MEGNICVCHYTYKIQFKVGLLENQTVSFASLLYYISQLTKGLTIAGSIISKISESFTFILPNLNNFHSFEVVNRVSETQLQVRENLN